MKEKESTTSRRRKKDERSIRKHSRSCHDENCGIEGGLAGETAAMDERAYTLCKITQASRKSKGASKTKDCWGIGVPKGQYYVKMDDFNINDESDRLHKRTDEMKVVLVQFAVSRKRIVYFLIRSFVFFLFFSLKT